MKTERSKFGVEYRYGAIAAIGAMLVSCGLLFAWLLRFDFHLAYADLFWRSIPLLVGIRLVVLWRLGLLRGWWHLTGVYDVIRIAKAVAAGSLIFFVLARYVVLGVAYPRSIYFLESLITAVLLATTRIAFRLVSEASRGEDHQARKTIVIGAGSTALALVSTLRRRGSGYRVIGALDDNPSKQGLLVNGVRVLGSVDRLPEIAAETQVDEIIIAVRKTTGKQMRRFVETCDKARLRVRTVSAMGGSEPEQVQLDAIRNVAVEDLLSRDPVKLDFSRVSSRIHGSAIVVTGAAGSIGSELCRQILRFQPRMLICIDHDENATVELQEELTRSHGTSFIYYYVANVGDTACMRRILREHRGDAIFHAAAHKHVPVMESNAAEAVSNNVFAMLRLVEAAEHAGCGTFLFISSDKAVNPSSIMGCTKRIGELIAATRPSPRMRCLSVRFGNVLGSSGSLIPILQRQLVRNESLTITHPEASRFFMTTSEAVSLVLQSFDIGESGDVLVLDMGEPSRIVDIARLLVSLAGKQPQDVEICYTGLRPGEKLHEELFYASEQVLPSGCDGILRVRGVRPTWESLTQNLNDLQAALDKNDEHVRAALRRLIPEYGEARPSGSARTGKASSAIAT